MSSILGSQFPEYVDFGTGSESVGPLEQERRQCGGGGRGAGRGVESVWVQILGREQSGLVGESAPQGPGVQLVRRPVRSAAAEQLL